MSRRLNNRQREILLAVAAGAEIQALLVDLQLLESRQLVGRSFWAPSGQQHASGAAMGWVTAKAASAGQKLASRGRTVQ